MGIAFLAIFWAMQVACHVSFKYGSTSAGRWVPFFLIGNGVGIVSTWILMMLYTRWNPNVALGLGMGGGFLLSQLAIAVLFRSQLSLLQIAGVVAIGLGMALLTGGGVAVKA